MAERNTRVRHSQIRSILPDDIEAINAIQDNYYIRKASGQSKFEWVAGSGSVNQLNDLSDVDFDTGTPQDDYIMRYDSASSKWKAEALVINTDKIEEDDSKVEVVDITGGSYITNVVDNNEITRFDSNGLDLKIGAYRYTGYDFLKELNTDGIVLGKEAGLYNTGDKNTFIGKEAGKGQSGLSTGTEGTFVGIRAGYNFTSGIYNTFIGAYAGQAITSETYNTFIGARAGQNATSNYNTFIGAWAGIDNTSGYNNTFVGVKSGQKNTIASNNTFIGHGAGNQNTTGEHNTFIGQAAGNQNTEGEYNTFVGQLSGCQNIADFNTFIGMKAGYWNTTGEYNTFVGHAAGQGQDITGGCTGYGNTFIGRYSGRLNTTGIYNTFIGVNAGENNIGGQQNTFVGHAAGNQNTEGEYNVFIGAGSGRNNISGNKNVFIGNHAGYNETGSNKLYIENDGKVTGSVPLIYGEFDNEYVKINGKQEITGELKIKIYAQASEPTLNADDYMAIWKDTDDSNRIYLLFRRGSGDVVGVELT